MLLGRRANTLPKRSFVFLSSVMPVARFGHFGEALERRREPSADRSSSVTLSLYSNPPPRQKSFIPKICLLTADSTSPLVGFILVLFADATVVLSIGTVQIKMFCFGIWCVYWGGGGLVQLITESPQFV